MLKIKLGKLLLSTIIGALIAASGYHLYRLELLEHNLEAKLLRLNDRIAALPQEYDNLTVNATNVLLKEAIFWLELADVNWLYTFEDAAITNYMAKAIEKLQIVIKISDNHVLDNKLVEIIQVLQQTSENLPASPGLAMLLNDIDGLRAWIDRKLVNANGDIKNSPQENKKFNLWASINSQIKIKRHTKSPRYEELLLIIEQLRWSLLTRQPNYFKYQLEKISNWSTLQLQQNLLTDNDYSQLDSIIQKLSLFDELNHAIDLSAEIQRLATIISEGAV